MGLCAHRATINSRTNKRRFMIFLVENRRRETLFPIIQNFVPVECPLLLSDSYSTYLSLRNEFGYNHHMVNHSQRYVNSEPLNFVWNNQQYMNVKVHTQNVERFNRSLKTIMKKKYGIARAFHERELMAAGFRVMYGGRLWNRAVALLLKNEFQTLWNLE